MQEATGSSPEGQRRNGHHEADRRLSAKERRKAWKQQAAGKAEDEEAEELYREDIEAALAKDPDPEPWEEGCYGLIAAPWLVLARERALETFNKDEAAEAAAQYNVYFTFSTLLIGFEGFILTDYLNNATNPGPFNNVTIWLVFLIMWSFIVNVFLAVITLHMAKTTSAHTYKPWHRAFLPLVQWGCRFSVLLFAIGVNLIIARSTGLAEGYKIALYTFTGVGFLWVCFIYISVWFGPTDRILAHMTPHNKFGETCCAWLTGTRPIDNDLLEIHAQSLKDDVQKDLVIEHERVKHWRSKKKQKLQEWEEEAHQFAMATLRKAHLPAAADFLEHHHHHEAERTDTSGGENGDVDKGKEPHEE